MLNKFVVMRSSVLVLLSAFFLSCEEITDIGFKDLGNSDGITYYTDTLTLETATFLIDSAITSGQGAASVGAYRDPLFGNIGSSAYIQPTLQQTSSANGSIITNPFTMDENDVYDSLLIRFINKSKIMYGDTNASLTLQVHRLNNPLETNKNYNFDHEVPFNPEPIASIEIDRTDLSNEAGDTTKYIKIRLPDEIGLELVNLLGTEAAEDREKFIEAFPGFAITAKEGSEVLMAFNLGSSRSSNTDLVIYHHPEGLTTVDGYQFEFTAGRFNQATTDRSETELAPLVEVTQSLSSSETNGRTFVQAGNGLGTKITFPGFINLGRPKVNLAQITFSADTTAFSENFPSAPFITYLNMENDGGVSRINSNYSYINRTVNTANGILSTYVDSTNQFVADITPYMHAITSQNTTDNGIGLVVAIPNSSGLRGVVFNAGLNRIVLQNFKLHLYYTK